MLFANRTQMDITDLKYSHINGGGNFYMFDLQTQRIQQRIPRQEQNHSNNKPS